MSVEASQVQGTCASMCFCLSSPARWSRPATSVIGARPRSVSSTASGLCFDRRMASSSSGLYAMTLPPRDPASALTTTLGSASSMRVASEPLAKPPNTTQWMAPMRAQASIAKAASGIIGM
ncbi:hypothetical protein FQZ97_665220 [compost metagenome]